LHPGVNGRSDRPTEWIPDHIVEPSEELFGSMLIKILPKAKESGVVEFGVWKLEVGRREERQ
jgi:hypothetical protein